MSKFVAVNSQRVSLFLLSMQRPLHGEPIRRRTPHQATTISPSIFKIFHQIMQILKNPQKPFKNFLQFHYVMEFIDLVSVILLCFLCFQSEVAFSDLTADRAALLRLSSAVRGNTLRWNRSDPSPCSWTGVKCDNAINRVIYVRLPADGLSGKIPPNSIGSLTQLQILSLRGNRLSGGIPPDLEYCSELRKLFLQNNRLSGEIPATLFRLANLTHLDISDNNFSGELSPDFDNLTKLRNLSLQNNQFTGPIPDLNRVFSQFNVSFNRLNGRIPSRLANFPANSFAGNEQLCGTPLDSCPNDGESNKLSAGAIAGIAIGSATGSILIMAAIFLLCRSYNRSRNSSQVVQAAASPTPPSPEKPPEYTSRSPDPILGTGSEDGYSGQAENNDELVFFGEGGFLLEDLLRASAEVLGKGTVGTTYKAYLRDEGEVIVKRLKNVCVSEREFTRRIVCLGELYHENLLPVRGYYYGKEEKLLVFDFMPMGSLSSVLHGNKGADSGVTSPLTWEIRSTIALQVARGLEHLHSHNLSHGNIKSNNILLTHRYGASISEFGLTQLVSSPTPNLAGYRAPEVIDARVTSKEADVYGFGILILELLTGKDPTVVLNEEGIDLPTWVQSVDEEKWSISVFDPNLLENPNDEVHIIKLLHLGIRCASQVPSRRRSMVEVVRRIKKIC